MIRSIFSVNEEFIQNENINKLLKLLGYNDMKTNLTNITDLHVSVEVMVDVGGKLLDRLFVVARDNNELFRSWREELLPLLDLGTEKAEYYVSQREQAFKLRLTSQYPCTLSSQHYVAQLKQLPLSGSCTTNCPRYFIKNI